MEVRIVDNITGEPWDFGMVQRMNFSITMEFGLRRWEDIESAISNSWEMLKYPLIGSKMYDLVIEFFEKKLNLDRVKKLLKDITENVGMYDFVIEARNMITKSDYGASVMSKLMRIITLTIKAYNLGRLEGVHSESKSVLISNGLDPYDCQTMLTVEANKRPDIRRKVSSLPLIYGSDAKRFEKYLRTVDTFNIESQIHSLGDKELIDYVNSLHNANIYAYFCNLYIEHSEDFYPNYELMSSSMWERDDNDSSGILGMSNFIFTTLLDYDVMLNRKFFVREKGVRIVFNEPLRNLQSIDVREYHSPDDSKYEEHYFTFFYTLTNGSNRMVYIDMTRLGSVSTPILYEMDAEVTLLMLAWLGLLDTAFLTEDKLSELFDANGVNEYDRKHLGTFTQDINRLIKEMIDSMNPENFTYYTPSQWNYDVFSSKSSDKLYIPEEPRKLVKVGRYTRRLPEGQTASLEAQALAKRFFIELKEGYTLVDEHEKVARRSNGVI